VLPTPATTHVPWRGRAGCRRPRPCWHRWRGDNRGTHALTLVRDFTTNCVSQLRPTVEERSSRWTIARFIFLCRVACVCLVTWARIGLSSGQHKHVAHRHASHTASILAVLLYAVALPGIANRKVRPQTMRSALGADEAILGLSTVSPLGLVASLRLR
jgi:hypothetical protein